MTKELLIGQLRAGNNGSEILAILDLITDGMDLCESSPDAAPTLEEIQF